MTVYLEPRGNNTTNDHGECHAHVAPAREAVSVCGAAADARHAFAVRTQGGRGVEWLATAVGAVDALSLAAGLATQRHSCPKWPRPRTPPRPLRPCRDPEDDGGLNHALPRPRALLHNRSHARRQRRTALAPKPSLGPATPHSNGAAITIGVRGFCSALRRLPQHSACACCDAGRPACPAPSRSPKSKCELSSIGSVTQGNAFNPRPTVIDALRCTL